VQHPARRVTAPGSEVDVFGMGVVASAGKVKVVGCDSADRLGRDGPTDGWVTLLRVGGGLLRTAFFELFVIVACFAFAFSVSSSSSASSTSSSLFFFSLILRAPVSLACLYLTYLKPSIRNEKGVLTSKPGANGTFSIDGGSSCSSTPSS